MEFTQKGIWSESVSLLILSSHFFMAQFGEQQEYCVNFMKLVSNSASYSKTL